MDYRLEQLIFICCCFAGTVHCFPIPSSQVGELFVGVVIFVNQSFYLNSIDGWLNSYVFHYTLKYCERPSEYDFFWV